MSAAQQMSCGPRWNFPAFVFRCCFALAHASLDQPPLLCAETLLSVLTAEESEEALLYCVGALKFLSGNGAILRLLLDNDCMGVAQRLIGRLCGAEDARSAMAGHILVQVRRWEAAWIGRNEKESLEKVFPSVQVDKDTNIRLFNGDKMKNVVLTLFSTQSDSVLPYYIFVINTSSAPAGA